jgi:hypothetical protein
MGAISTPPTFAHPKAVFLAVCLVVGVLDLIISKTPGRIYGYDDMYYFMYLPSLVVDGDLEFTNQLEEFQRLREDKVLDHVIRNTDGRIVNKFGIGYALLALPFFLLGFPATAVARFLGFPLRYDGMNLLFQLATTFASVVWGFIGLGLCQSMLQRHFPECASRRATWMIFGATPLVYYMCISPTMAHASAFFSTTLWFYLWDRREATLPYKQAVLLGFAGALCLMVRYPNVLVWSGIAVDWFRWHAERNPDSGAARWFKFWAFAGVSFLICITPQLAAWQTMFGSILTNPYPPGDRFPYWLDPRIGSLLLSDARGLFNWHPLLLFAVVGLAACAREHRWLATHAWLTLSGLVYLYASFHSQTFGVAFGSRVFVDALPFFAVGLAAFLRPGKTAGLRWGICLVGVGLNLLMAAAYRSHAIPERAVLSWPARVEALATVPSQLARGFEIISPRLQGLLSGEFLGRRANLTAGVDSSVAERKS